ncbi:LLM class flavin-dependent oxidoreductase [Cohnella zeiphila]|uniref:LLM class flavin-dependent oxidoreductase n=1 Tax=Cohnella zeiphila TaxID=2761120 RepID=A0A7X0STC1_9BACL|nr:LLM class flavin-dependent oxidoreductase [Cohnella zeiphila]MBB6733518.1 LLM class flavin-dependent oxidoreductase [Cohnella zeiphila]
MSLNDRPLRLGVLDLVPVLEERDDAAALEQAATLARTAERLGFSRYWVAEHHAMPNLACPAPEVLLAHVGARTERIRIGSGALLLPHYEPLKVAESFRLLAALYPGRVDLGLGRAPGGDAHASMALSGNYLENVRRYPDKLRAVAELLQDRYAFEGESVVARPRPAVPPELWLLGTNRKSAEFAARFGTGYAFGQFMSDADGEETLKAYRDAFVSSAFGSVPRAIVAIGVLCAETEEEAQRLATDSGMLFRGETTLSGKEAAPISGDRLLVGTPEKVRGRLEQLSRRFGVDEFLIVTMGPDYDRRLRSFEQLVRAWDAV